MADKFDELTKGMAQSVRRRQALKQFGVGLAAMALACFSFGNKARASFIHTCVDSNCAGYVCPKGTHCKGWHKNYCYCV